MSKKQEELVDSLSDALRKALSKPDKESGLSTPTGDVHGENLPEGLNVELRNKMRHYDLAFGAAMLRVTGELAKDAMIKDAELETVQSKAKMGPFHLCTAYVDRDKEQPMRNEDGSLGRQTVHGASGVRLAVVTPGSKSLIKAEKATILELFKDVP